MGRTSFPEFSGLSVREPCLYALETSDGLVKVGRSGSPRQRMYCHARELSRRGLRIVRFVVAPAVHWDIYTAEGELLRRLNQRATTRPGRTEWFQGIAYGAAATLVRQIARREFITAHA